MSDEAFDVPPKVISSWNTPHFFFKAILASRIKIISQAAIQSNANGTFIVCEKASPGISLSRMMIAAVEQIGCRYMFVFIKKNPKRAYINVIQEGRIYPFVIVAIDRTGKVQRL